MAAGPDITAEVARSIFSYDHKTGFLTWKHRAGVPRKCNSRFAGKRAGSPDMHGYLTVRVNYKSYKVHRLAWLIAHGHWPPELIDHMNGVPDDNRIENLRLASVSQNRFNSVVSRRSASGLKGAYLSKQSGRFFSSIVVRGKCHHLGTFTTAEEAHAAYCDAAERLQGEYRRAP